MVLEVVLIRDLVATHRTDWAAVASTRSLQQLKIGDGLRKRGDGEGKEELRVEAIRDSPPALLLGRGHHSTPVDYHPLGTVLDLLERRSKPKAEEGELAASL